MEIGMLFPSFNLYDQNGESIDSKTLEGQKYIISSYPKAMTPGCTAEMCSLRDYKEEFKKRGFLIFGLSNDEPMRNRKFAEKHDLSFPLLSDVDFEFLKKIDGYGEKTVFGKKKTGILRKTWLVGEDGKLLQIVKQVKTKTHGEDLISVIEKHGW